MNQLSDEDLDFVITMMEKLNKKRRNNVMNIVNFQKMQELAHEFLLKYWWEGTFPIDTVKIAKRIAEEKDDFEIYTYKELSIKLDIPIAKLKKISEYGYNYLSNDGKTHIIAYNEEGYDYVPFSGDEEKEEEVCNGL